MPILKHLMKHLRSFLNLRFENKIYIAPQRATPSVKTLVEYEKNHWSVFSIYNLGLENG